MKTLKKLNNIPFNKNRITLESVQILKIPILKCCPNGIEKIYYIIGYGDNLKGIASRYLGKSFIKSRKQFVNAICTWNGIKNKNAMRKEQKLIIYLCK
jgi:hypothetical protein